MLLKQTKMKKKISYRDEILSQKDEKIKNWNRNWVYSPELINLGV